MEEPKGDVLLEASWEVCNKVGGIYTVVRSKAEILNRLYKDYILFGPYVADKAKNEFEQESPPENIRKAFTNMEKKGIVCHYGKWLIKGEPKTILVDFSNYSSKLDDIKKEMWEDYKIDSMFSQWDFDEPMIWAYAVGMLMEELQDCFDGKVVAQFHEWLAGFSLLYLKKRNARIGTVFTTHATMLGRSIAGSGRDLYAEIGHIDPEEEAKKIGINDKFTTERAAANTCDIFTTVSGTTASEAEKILGRKPEVLVLNGLDFSKFPTFEEASIKHRICRDLMRDFLSYTFYPHYWFDIKHTLNYFIIGRNEYRNKGIDITIQALGRLNYQLKKENSDRNIAAFFFIPDQTFGTKVDLLENKAHYRHITNGLKRNWDEVQENIMSSLFKQTDEKEEEEACLLPKEFMQEIKRNLNAFKKEGHPIFSTHNLKDEDNNQIVKAFKENGLNNNEDDKVKVILFPVYLTGTDGLLDLAYYEAISAGHLGLFPSYYEPWGYTPLESAAFGVPAITSDTSGFGKFIKEKQKDSEEKGIYVLERDGKPHEEVVQKYTEMLYKYSQHDRKERVNEKIEAINLAKEADWNVLIENYINAHNKALDKI